MDSVGISVAAAAAVAVFEAAEAILKYPLKLKGSLKEDKKLA
ncbi:hypothetical protein [Paenibacillus sp. P32E]|nr:hypothetical protein [Paenibacillus sp. P32E]